MQLMSLLGGWNHHLRAKNLAFLGLVSISLSSELLLVVPLAISDLALVREYIAHGRGRVRH